MRISYRFCDRCDRRRRFYRTTRGDLGTLRCSQGHVTIFEVGTFEKVTELMRAQVVPKLIENFHHEDAFYKVLKGR